MRKVPEKMFVPIELPQAIRRAVVDIAVTCMALTSREYACLHKRWKIHRVLSASLPDAFCEIATVIDSFFGEVNHVWSKAWDDSGRYQEAGCDVARDATHRESTTATMRALELTGRTINV